ncbi:DinB family protein [Gemmatimonas aurantiaca]|uniref:DinB family protein n=1 Tax=Gemmatimonas aurantiaca TaxID=173480 RepID=UPI00301B8190
MPSLRPSTSEHAPWALPYIEATEAALAASGSDDVVKLLESQPGLLRKMLAGAPADIGAFAYAPDKWTLGESLLHVADTERVFAYRLLRVARADGTPLPGFDQDAWVPESRASRRSLEDIIGELESVRAATLTLVRSLDDTALTRTGTASNHAVSSRALIWMITGHMAHHLGITRDRYLAAR